MPAPAEMLLGKTLSGGWTVVERHVRPAGASGSMFSVGYIVEAPSGTRAFLKALDVSKALADPNWPVVVQHMLETFNYESDLLMQCAGYDRVVTAIDQGEADADPSSVIGRVRYLIFELGDGDIRSHLAVAARFDTAWALRCLHQVTVGMNQLHGGDIAHQDLKPSNVVTFGDDGARVADMGCASRRGVAAPRDSFLWAGDGSYAPPELLYRYALPDWDARRFGRDTYLLGSMVAFMFTQAGMTALLLAQLAPPHRPDARRRSASRASSTMRQSRNVPMHTRVSRSATRAARWRGSPQSSCGTIPCGPRGPAHHDGLHAPGERAPARARRRSKGRRVLDSSSADGRRRMK